MQNDLVFYSAAEGIATVTLNRPDKGNALSRAMMDAIEAAIYHAEEDHDIRVIVLAANGKIFCAGHDLEEMLENEDREWQEAHFARCSSLMATIRDCPKPVIAKVQGAAVAAGCQLVATCDLAYAVRSAKFGINGINLGLFCSTPAVALSRAVPRKQALEMALTGKLILAPKAEEIGLINHAVASEDLDDTVLEAARAIASKQPRAIALGKGLFYEQIEVDIDDAYRMAGQRMARNMEFAETRDGIRAFVKKD